jgi:hypothetical protein
MAGAEVNLQNRWKNTPLIVTCKGGHVSVVKELVKAGADMNLQDREGNTPLKTVVRKGYLSKLKHCVKHRAHWATQVVYIKVSEVYIAFINNKLDIVHYLIQEQNKIMPGEYDGNVRLFNCLVDIRHARVTSDSRDDVIVTDRPVWYMDSEGDLWKTIREEDCDVFKHLLCMGLNVNQLIHMYPRHYRNFAVKPLLYALIDGNHVNDRTKKVKILLGAGADVNIRVKYKGYDSQLQGVSVLERTKRLVCKYNDSELKRYKVPEYKSVNFEIRKHVRRYSI